MLSSRSADSFCQPQCHDHRRDGDKDLQRAADDSDNSQKNGRTCGNDYKPDQIGNVALRISAVLVPDDHKQIDQQQDSRQKGKYNM